MTAPGVRSTPNSEHHDPLCCRGTCWEDCPCHCELIAKVRADERNCGEPGLCHKCLAVIAAIRGEA
jgi:hypothetical protein